MLSWESFCGLMTIGEAGGWHFFMTSVVEKLKSYDGDYQVLHRMMNTRNNIPFMD